MVSEENNGIDQDGRTMKKRIQGLLCIMMCLVFAVPVFAAENPAKADASDSSGGLVEIQSPAFFDDLPGTQYVYFGRPTSAECVAFETHLQTFYNEP